jgi:hypothetical protein
MAKPGSDAARDLAAMSRAAAEIRREIPAGIKADLLWKIEGQLGLRCGGCGRRIKVGFQFTKIDVVLIADHPKADVLKLSACDRDDCDFAEEARKGADVVEMVEYAWLVDVDEERPGEDTTPAATESGVFPAGSGAEPEGNGSTPASE